MSVVSCFKTNRTKNALSFLEIALAAGTLSKNQIIKHTQEKITKLAPSDIPTLSRVLEWKPLAADATDEEIEDDNVAYMQAVQETCLDNRATKLRNMRGEKFAACLLVLVFLLRHAQFHKTPSGYGIHFNTTISYISQQTMMNEIRVKRALVALKWAGILTTVKRLAVYKSPDGKHGLSAVRVLSKEFFTLLRVNKIWDKLAVRWRKKIRDKLPSELDDKAQRMLFRFAAHPKGAQAKKAFIWYLMNRKFSYGPDG